MKVILLVALWLTVILGSVTAFAIGGIWAFESGRYVMGGVLCIGFVLFTATYATTERFTKWPPKL